jgi:hypothetical protein
MLNSTPETTQAPFDWREHLPVHPAADLFPLMSKAELEELAADIKAHGVIEQIVIFYAENDPAPFLLDGRNRLDALALAGALSVDDIGSLHIKARGGSSVPIRYRFEREHDPYALALSYNVHRRHLNAEQKRDLIAAVLKAKPDLSGREIARMTKSSPTTIGKKRGESAAANVQSGHKERKEASGRNARGRKAGQAAAKSKSSGTAKGRSPGFDRLCAEAEALGFQVRCEFGSPGGYLLLHGDGSTPARDARGYEVHFTSLADGRERLKEIAAKKTEGAKHAATEAQTNDDQTNPLIAAWNAATDEQRVEFDQHIAGLKKPQQLAKALAALLDPAKTLTPALVTKAIDFLPAHLFAKGFSQAQRLQAALEEANAAKRLATGTFVKTSLITNGNATPTSPPVAPSSGATS